MITAKLQILDTIEKLNRFYSYVEKFQPEYTVLDTETNGVQEKTCKLYGIGLCFNSDFAFYIPWRSKDGQQIWTTVQQTIITDYLLNLCQKTKVIGHNIIYDVLVLENNLRLDITDNIYSDTILQKHTLNEEPPHGLKPTAVHYLGEWADNAQEKLHENIKANGGKTTKENMEMFKADTEVLAEYCMWDVLLTWELFKIFEEKLYNEDLYKLFYEDEIMPLYKLVTIPMKRKGFPVDVPYYQQLKTDITKDIIRLEDEIMVDIQEHIGHFAKKLLDEEVPINNKGKFPQVLAANIGVVLPVNKEGKVTLAKKAIEAQKEIVPQDSYFYDWLLSEKGSKAPKELQTLLEKTQRQMFFESHPEQRYVFNLKSNDHLGYLLCKCLGHKPLEKTEKTGKPQINDDFLDTLKDDPSVAKLLDYKKLNKLLSTYVDGILDRQIDGIIYTSMLQFGTTSGRYSSRDPNLQNQPRIKDEDSGLSPMVLHYVNAIRKGFIAGPGRKIVNADYSQLEPTCFAHMSGDEGLREIFRKNLDFYSKIAIDVFKMENISADKKAPNFLKKIQPAFRDKAKVFVLAVPYGAEGARISEAMSCSYNEANSVIKAYLDAYPNLKKYMENCNFEAKKKGFVKTEFGRVRHLPNVRNWYLLYNNQLLDYKWANSKGLSQERRLYKNSLNNAKNFKIQGLAAHIVNRAMIAVTKVFKTHNIEGWIGLQVHDEVTCIVREDQAELASKLLQECMEKTTTISVPLSAVPLIADSWADAK